MTPDSIKDFVNHSHDMEANAVINWLLAENERLRHEAERDAAILAAFQAGSVKQTDAILALRAALESLYDATTLVREWRWEIMSAGDAYLLEEARKKVRVVLGGGNE